LAAVHDLSLCVVATAPAQGSPEKGSVLMVVKTPLQSLKHVGSYEILKKLGEGAIEAGLAAVQEDRARLTAEAADLLYHLLVLLKARGVTLAEVEAALEKRTAQTGHEEKASRAR